MSENDCNPIMYLQNDEQFLSTFWRKSQERETFRSWYASNDTYLAWSGYEITKVNHILDETERYVLYSEWID